MIIIYLEACLLEYWIFKIKFRLNQIIIMVFRINTGFSLIKAKNFKSLEETATCGLNRLTHLQSLQGTSKNRNTDRLNIKQRS